MLEFPWNQLLVPIVVLWFICTQPEPGSVVISLKPSLTGAHDDTGVEVGVAGGVVAVGVGVPHSPSCTRTVSILQPRLLSPESDAMRKRNLIVWPATLGPSKAIVLT